jgi:hypothetical protein
MLLLRPVCVGRLGRRVPEGPEERCTASTSAEPARPAQGLRVDRQRTDQERRALLDEPQEAHYQEKCPEEWREERPHGGGRGGRADGRQQ